MKSLYNLLLSEKFVFYQKKLIGVKRSKLLMK